MKPPDVVADFDRCGGGQGVACCIYLVVGSKGFECAREDPDLRVALQMRRPRMTSQRAPVSPFPACQEEGR